MTARFPSLPTFPLSSHYEEQSWSPNVYEVHAKLKALYQSASRLLSQEADPLRLQIQLETIVEELPLLEALEECAEDEHVPQEWILEVAKVFGEIIKALYEAQYTARQRDESNIYFENPVTVTRSGRRGRPRKEVHVGFMKRFASPKYNFRLKTIASSIKVCRNTLKARLKESKVNYKYSSISNTELDALVRLYRRTKIGSGVRYLTGRLRNIHKLKIQRHRVYSSVRRVDAVGTMLRSRKNIRRRRYGVKRPNALWHVDGHHKLILWGIVIHGFIDGFDRFITAMCASVNNKASTVFELLLEAIEKCGEPSRLRGDRGKENKLAALYMIARKGVNRGSFIWGPSTRNTRIERIWVETGTQFVRRWRAFFFRLESLHGLDRSNPHHLWLLHQLFLGMINEDCQEFVLEWNAHPISGEGHDKSPEEMRLLGKLNEGMCIPDDCEGLDPQEIQRRYGVLGSPEVHPSNHTGAGYLPDEDVDDLPGHRLDDEDDSSDSEVEDDLPTGYDNQFIEAVKTPSHRSPFKDCPELEKVFVDAIAMATNEDILPSGYGILPVEWENGVYPPYELIRSGKRAGKELRVDLPDGIWRPRAELWARGLDILLHMQAVIAK